MEARREEIDTSHTRFIDAANPLFYSLSVVLIFFTLLSLSWPLVALWSCGFGVLGAYLLFRNRKLVPNLLLHLRPVVNVEEDGDNSVKDLMCPVCSNANCSRHKVLKPNDCDVSMPWKDLSVPETIDNSLSNFLNIIMARFITTWHKDITQTKSFDTQVRKIIRHALCLFLCRVKELDIPKIVTGPLLQVLAEHMQLYINVRKKVPPNSSLKLIESVAIETLGPRLHTAFKGKTEEFRYFKNLTKIALPFLLSSDNIKSKVMKIFLEELRFLGGKLRNLIGGLVCIVMKRSYYGQLSYLPIEEDETKSPLTEAEGSIHSTNTLKPTTDVGVSDPIPEHWKTIEGNFVIFMALTSSHITENDMMCVETKTGSGKFKILYTFDDATRGQLLAKLSESTGAVKIENFHEIHTRAFRLNPISLCIITVDGEQIDYGPIQVQMHPGMMRLYSRVRCE